MDDDEWTDEGTRMVARLRFVDPPAFTNKDFVSITMRFDQDGELVGGHQVVVTDDGATRVEGTPG